ncbi:Uncharacterised protein [Vibrio cholerae]|nr:Uncharacterised protein [Vibrio cholerae]
MFNHFWQTMQRLWAEDDIHIRRTIANRVTFLSSNTATDTDHDTWLLVFQGFPTTELVEDFFLRLFTNRTGV